MISSESVLEHKKSVLMHKNPPCWIYFLLELPFHAPAPISVLDCQVPTHDSFIHTKIKDDRTS